MLGILSTIARILFQAQCLWWKPKEQPILISFINVLIFVTLRVYTFLCPSTILYTTLCHCVKPTIQLGGSEVFNVLQFVHVLSFFLAVFLGKFRFHLCLSIVLLVLSSAFHLGRLCNIYHSVYFYVYFSLRCLT